MLTTERKPRTKACKHCRQPFAPARPLQRACGPSCAIALARFDREKAERATARKTRQETRAKLEKLKRRADWIAEAQAAFNAYIRKRDEGLPCICCGRTSTGWTRGGEWDAGHFRSRGASPHLRFDERNCHAQLKQCNRRAWDVAGYRTNLVQRIGLEAVEALEADQESRKWSVDDLKAIKAEYVAKRKEIIGGQKDA